MASNEIAVDKKTTDDNYNDISESNYSSNHLNILRKSSPDFDQDPESTSICPLLTPSPTSGEFQVMEDPLSGCSSLERNILLEEKRLSPDYNQDEETALLSSSPSASYTHTMEPPRASKFFSSFY